MKKMLISALFIACSFTLSACASGARSQQMIPAMKQDVMASKNSPLYKNIELATVIGGKNTNPMWTSQVSSMDFENALKEALVNSGYLSSAGSSSYLLRADLMELKQPLFGLQFNVTSTVDYTLQNKRSKEMKYSRKITAIGSASFSDSALAVERLRIANERSIQKNLETLLEDLRQQK